MPNRIDQTFESLRADGKAAFVAYLCAGDPLPDATPRLVAALEAVGADIVELGIPFSDPLADGATNQAAASRALEAGTSVRAVFEMIRRIRSSSEIPLVLFTYLNPVYVYGFEKFHAAAAEAGADGVLILDLPPDEAERNAELQGAFGLKAIRLIAPTTPEERIEKICKAADGFIYYVSREGVTGEQTSLSDTIAEQVALIKRHTRLPVVVGFGISSPEQAASVAAQADGVVVGSAIVRRVEEAGEAEKAAASIQEFVGPLVAAVHAAQPTISD